MSIVQRDESRCYLCGRNGNGDPLETHHIMFGPYRAKADKDGLTVKLCGARCHRLGPDSAHQNRQTNTKLKQDAQRAFEQTHSREEWLERYGRNYL